MTFSLEGPPVGGGFLLEPCGARDGFVPEQLSEDARDFAAAGRRFMDGEVLARSDEIDTLPDGLMPSLLRKAGELGFLAVDVPEAYGGLQLDKRTSTLLDEVWSLQSSFSVSRGGHCGIGTLPVIFFGTDAQKTRYLPKLATGESLAAYALSEPGSGSDALGARSTARLSDDGSEWILNGTKQFITNAGFADLFTVFAKVDGSQFTAFLVDKDAPGLSTGAEEKKMGQKGSSTRQLIMEDCRIPADSVLGEIGKGHRVAFNILNIGRLKLGACVLGGAKVLLEKTIEYCCQREQFGTPIIQFTALRKKVADMVSRCYAAEAMAYRIAGYLDDRLAELDPGADDYNVKALSIIEEYAVETSIMKVFGTETNYVFVDECFQMYGGYGFLNEYPAERPYRDERVNRIYEGTNEINRLLIPGTLVKRAMRGRLRLMPWLMEIRSAAASATPVTLPEGDDLAPEAGVAGAAKRLFGLLTGAAIERYSEGLEREQEVMLALADIGTDAYALDAAVARARKGDDAFHAACATYFVATAWDRLTSRARRIACTLDPGDGTLVDAAENMSPSFRSDQVTAGRVIADHVVERGGYKPY